MGEAKPLVVRDAAHDYVVFPPEQAELVRRLLKCPEVQRLRRIRQLGFSYVTYPGAEHSRFQHSLGAAYVGFRLCQQLQELGVILEDTHVLAMVGAALLHDVGHLPFSHATESALSQRGGDAKHEALTVDLIKSNTAINGVLNEFEPSLPDMVARIVSGGSPHPVEQVLHGFIDGNLDVDRIDFVLRDSVHTGVRSGMVDLHRLLTGFVVHNNMPLFELKNLATVEEFLIARFLMYEKVYFHRTTRGMEVVYKQFLTRLGDLIAQGSMSEQVAQHPLCRLLAGEHPPYEEFVLLDDGDIIALVKSVSTDSEDAVARDLAHRLLWRRPFKAVADGGTDMGALLDAYTAAEHCVGAAGLNPKYYVDWDRTSDLPYRYSVWAGPGEGKPPLEVLVDGEPQEISLHSPVAHALMQQRTHVRVYAPEEFKRGVAKLVTTK